jgi:hypothetical protein
MLQSQSLHIHIKEPPNPNPIRTLGVFSNLSDSALRSIIESFLSEIQAEPHSEEFEGNVRDEVYKILSTGTVLSVCRRDGYMQVNIREKRK